MLNKTKLTVAAALVLASASAVMAQDNGGQLASDGTAYRATHRQHADGNVGYAERHRYDAPQSAPFRDEAPSWFNRSTSNVNNE